MADEVREVKVRLGVERTGDDRALGAAADEIEQLDPAAQKAQAALDQLQEAFVRFGEARGPAAQKRALEELARTYVETGKVAAESFEAGSVEAVALQQVIAAIEDEIAKMGDGLAGALARGEDAFLKLERSIANGGEGIQKKLTAVQQSIREITREIERSEAAGQQVTAAQEAQLEQLDQAYRDGARTAGEYRAAQQQVQRDLDRTTEAAGGQARALRSIEDVLATGGGKWSRYALNVGAVIGTFTSFYSIGTKLRDLLNDITDDGFDRGVQKWAGFDALAGKLVGTLDEDAAAAARLTNNLNILRNQGIDPAGLSIREIDALVEQLGRGMQKQRQEASRAAEAHREWAEGIGVSKKALDDEAAALARNLRTFAEANQGVLSAADLKKLFGEQIQGVLDQYARLNQEPPEAIRQLAAEWGVLTSAAQQAVDEHRQIVDQLRQDLVGAAEKGKEEIEKLARALPEALEGVDFRELKIVDPEQFAAARERITAILTEIREAGVEVDASLAAAATQLGLFVSASEAGGGAGLSFAAGADAAADSAQRMVESVDKAGNTVRTLLNDIGTAQPAIAGFSGAVDQNKAALDAYFEGLRAGAPNLHELAAAAGVAAPAVEDLGSRAGEAESQVAALTAAEREAAAAAESTAAASQAASSGAAQVAAALGDQAAGAGAAADATARAAGETERLGAAAAGVDLGGVQGEALSLVDVLRQLTAVLEQLRDALPQIGAGAAESLRPLREELKGVKADAEAAGAALAAAAASGTAGGTVIGTTAPASGGGGGGGGF